MSLTNLDAAKLKLILKTSEGFPSQHESSKAMVKAGNLSPSRTGHALSSHRGALACCETYLHVQTFYPMLDGMQIARLLDSRQGHSP